MARPKVEIPFLIESIDVATGKLQVASGATATIQNRDGTNAQIYSSEDATTPNATNQLTSTSTGRLDGWVREGRYNIQVSGAGLTTYTMPWDARSGGTLSIFGDALVGVIGPSNQSGIALGTGLSDPAVDPDTLWYRSAAAETRTNGTLVVDGAVRVNQARLIGAPTSLAIQDSTAANVVKASTGVTAFSDNAANTQRVEIGNNAGNTNYATLGGLGGVALARLGLAASGITIGNATTGALSVPTANSLRVDYAGGATTLNLSSTGANTGITIGGDVELYRTGANVLRIPDTVNVSAIQINGTALGSTHLSDTANISLLNGVQTYTVAKTFTGGLLGQGAAGSFPLTAQTTGDTVPRFAVKADGTLEFGPGNAARNANLFWSATDILRTNDSLRVDGSLTASYGSGNEVGLGNLGPASAAAVVLNTVALYNSSGALRTAASAIIDSNLLLGTTTQRGRITLNTGTTAAEGISFGTSATAKTDRVDLFRSSAGVVTLDGNIVITGNFTVQGTTTTSTSQSSAGAFVAASGDVGQITIGNPGGNATVYFGSASDASLYRTAANSLRTPGSLTVDGTLTAAGIINITGVATNKSATNTSIAEVFQSNQTGSYIDRSRVLADGTHEWADATGAFDTSLTRSGVGVLSVTNFVNAISGFRVNGTALASTHLTDSAALARLAGPSFSGTVTSGGALVAQTTVGLASGLAATPSLIFTGDDNTGIWSPGPDVLAISTGGTERLRVSTSAVAITNATLSVGGQNVVVTNDARLSDTRAPSGAAGGSLTGTYPNPTLAPGVVSNAEVAANAAIADTKLAQIATAGKVAVSALGTAVTGTGNVVLANTPTLITPLLSANPAVDASNQLLIISTGWYYNQGSSVLPVMDGAATIGTSTRWARSDHIHPTDTTRAPLANPTFTGTVNAGAFISTATTVGFYGVPNVTQREGRAALSYASGAVAYDAAARTLSIGTSTLNTTQQVLANLIRDLQATGII